MPLLGVCKTCYGKVSNEAEECPHCGQPKPYHDSFMEDVKGVLKNTGKLAAIKLLRTYGPELSLKEASDIVEFNIDVL